MNRHVWFILLLFVHRSVLAQTAVETSADALTRIPAAMRGFVDSGAISGAVTLVGRGGKVVHLAAVGQADIESGRPMKKNTLFSIASMTKPLVATAVMVLQDEGKLNVEDNVSKYIPEFASLKLNKGTWRGIRIVSAEAARQMTTCQTGDLVTGFTPGNGWGLGWCIIRHPQGVTGMLSPGTFGHGGAFGTQGWVDPVTGSIYVLMIARDKLPNSDASAIRNEFQSRAARLGE